jgi:hypothetical protein
MISSEVQRTLVKSPPELWAEISDPEALARHLGEFGEIRITRVQPEQKVEWEAAEASGSIVIKPSGWGTKVKLTVMREPSGAKAGDAPDQVAPEGEPPALGEDPTAESGPAADRLASAAEDRGAPAVEAHEPKGTVDVAPPDRVTAPAEPIALEQPIPDLAAEDARDETGLDATGGELPGRLESPLEGPAEEDEPEPEPQRRRGFFARLFGRRRQARSSEEDGTESQAAPVAPELERASADATETAIETEDGDEYVDHDEADTVAPEIAATSPSSPALAPEEEIAIENQADLDVEPATPIATSETTDAPQDDEAVAHRSAPETAASAAAELEQAEEAAAEEVTAVLTGVLDRLGAAHHRPFSRA